MVHVPDVHSQGMPGVHVQDGPHISVRGASGAASGGAVSVGGTSGAVSSGGASGDVSDGDVSRVASIGVVSGRASMGGPASPPPPSPIDMGVSVLVSDASMPLSTTVDVSLPVVPGT